MTIKKPEEISNASAKLKKSKQYVKTLEKSLRERDQVLATVKLKLATLENEKQRASSSNSQQVSSSSSSDGYEVDDVFKRGW